MEYTLQSCASPAMDLYLQKVHKIDAIIKEVFNPVLVYSLTKNQPDTRYSCLINIFKAAVKTTKLLDVLVFHSSEASIYVLSHHWRDSNPG
jgi:hypothetical protein